MRKLYWSLLLPLLLLFSQQGELLHEYGHYRQPASSSSQQKAPGQTDTCSQCLAYAHLSGVAKPEITAPLLLAGLGFHFALRAEPASVDVRVAPARSRGPPSYL
jgi:hypothetical protein